MQNSYFSSRNNVVSAFDCIVLFFMYILFLYGMMITAKEKKKKNLLFKLIVFDFALKNRDDV